MRKVLVLVLRGTTWWEIKEGTPAAFSFGHRPGWALLTPVLYPRLQGDTEAEKCTVFAGPPGEPHSVLIATNLFCLETPFSDLQDASAFLLSDELTFLLNQLRYVSRFARSPRQIGFGRIAEIDLLSSQSLPLPSGKERAAITGFSIEAAMTAEKIVELVGLDPRFEPPIYSTLLLDAIEAHATGDLKKSVLYAAIAAETLADSKLSAAYDRICSQDTPDPGFRVVSFPTSQGPSERKDPVYEALAKSNSGHGMRRLMHELPLYLLGKSLLLDNQPVYDGILELYKQRNEIAHRGGARIDGAGFFSFYRPVAQSLRHVARLFEWYGEPGCYPILDQQVQLGQD